MLALSRLAFPKIQPRTRRSALTVCVAAICEDNIILGASDRMVTAGDVEFEPPQTKVTFLTSSIAVMIAGDSSLQVEIVYEARDEVQQRVVAEPTNWWRVRDVANIFFKNFKQAKRTRTENAILDPLGLDYDSFITRQQELSSELVDKIATEILNFEMSEIETIVTGVDTTGAHIYVVTNRGVTCRDSVGFAAIGAGYWHANSQFMFAGHARSKPVPQTLLLTYTAKKRAEVAPGVGEATDMFWIGPSVGNSFPVGDHVVGKLGEIYDTIRSESTAAQETAYTEVTKYVEELNAASTTETQASLPEGSDGHETSNEKKIGDGDSTKPDGGK